MANTIGKRESRIGFIGFTYRLGGQLNKDRERDDKRLSDNGGGTEGMSN